MPVEIKMPQLSDTMSSGKILAWKKKEGDVIVRGDILAEVETDKANLEIESFHNGTLLKIFVPQGSVGKVGEAIAVIGQPGESVSVQSQTQTVSPAQTKPTPQGVVTATQPSTPVAPQASLTVVSGTNERVKASPLARKMAEQSNVNLSALSGSGPNGRITRRDVEAALTNTGSGQQAVSPIVQRVESIQAGQPASGPTPGQLIQFTKMRETIARRMQESMNQSPHFYVTNSVDMGEALRLREKLKDLPQYKGISVNHLVIKAVAYGLSREPRVNFAVRDGQIFEPTQINVGIITAIDGGLLIPVIREADKLSLKDLIFEARAAVDRARAGRPSASDLVGGTFSISNMGMFDVENFTAIINPGQGGIIAVSSVKDVPIVKNGQVIPGKIMKATVSVDHRIIDGVMASQFLGFFKEALETPALLMV